MMKLLMMQPFMTELNHELSDCAIWSSATHLCAFQDKVNDPTIGNCDQSHIYYGTSDSQDPKFCARHFYLLIASGDGETTYRLVNDNGGR